LSAGRIGRLACALAALALSAAGVRAQMSANPLEIGHAIEALGRTLDPATVAATAALYAPLQEQEPYLGVRVHRDLKYGPDERNRLDVFAPDPLPAATRPTLIFVHGGGFVGGDKTTPGSPYYDNVGLWAARHGFVAINVTYRLAPAHPWPAGIEDIGAAVRWAIRNVAPYGSGPDRIFLMGHGAGAAHVAGYLAHPELQPPGGPGIAGAILISGVYDLTAMPLDPGLRAYYGGDPERYPERSAAAGLAESKVPLLLAAAEFDPVALEQQSTALKETLCAAKRCPRFIPLPKHNHLSEIYAINTKDTLLARSISDFIKAQ
jgi:acetyl esterase/lipase